MYRLLIADDEEKLLDGLCHFYPWKEMGYQVVGRVRNGEEALAFLSTHPVDVLLSDISMPKMNGTELAQHVAEQYPDIIIVFLSGYADFAYAQQAIRFGVKEYLLKPVKGEELRKVFLRIKETLDKEKGTAEPQPGYYKGIIQDVDGYIRGSLKTANLEDAALFVNLSAGYLSNLYKKETGSTFSESVLRFRMEKAKELLAGTEYKTYEISEKLGYENPKNFTRAFKGFYGITPREYKTSSEAG